MSGGYVDPGEMFARLIFLPLILLWVGSAAWVMWDSVQRTQVWGVLWGFLALGAAPIVVPLYIIAVVIANRPAPAWVERERAFQKEQVTKFKGMSEFDRVRYLEAAAGGAGTLYAGPGLRPSENGAKLFEDAHADRLLAAQDYDGAFVYLYDLYLLALEDNDPRGEQTYKHYIGQVPHGFDLLKRARERRVTPEMLKATGLSLIASAAPESRSRTRPVSDDPATAPHHRANADAAEAGLHAGLSLEQLLDTPGTSAPRPAPPAGGAAGIQPPRQPKPASGAKIPF
jgi:hypothetical protein